MPLPEMTPVNSSMLKSVAFDPATGTLFVQFHKGSQAYEYKDVPQATWNELVAAESPGGFFLNNVRGKFEPTKLDPDPEPEAA